MRLELIPLLLVALLMISAGGDVQTAELLIEGDHEITEHRGALIVGDATTTVPAEETIDGPVYVIGGEFRIEGRVDGDVTQLSGSLSVAEEGEIGGELEHVAGSQSIAAGAEIAERTTVEVTPAEPDPVAAYVPTVLTAFVLALVGALLARRRPGLLENISSAATDHPIVSLTAGGLVLVTFLSLFVFMAFTLILIPVSVLGILVGALAVGYGIIALGYRLGRRLDTDRAGLATAGGVLIVMALLQIFPVVPVVGELVAIAILLTGFGAVVLTYFGLATFEPVELPS